MRTLVGLLSVTLAMLNACGGGGGGGGSSEPTAATPPVQSSAFRALRVGDKWLFDTSGTFADGTSALGTLTMTITGSIQTPLGAVCYVVEEVLVINDGNNPFVARVSDYYKQDATGGIRHCGDNGISNGTRYSTNAGGTVLFVPATLAIGQVNSYVETFNNGEWLDCSERIDAYEVVPTASGPIGAFKMTRNCTASNQAVVTDEFWLNPDFFMVKQRSKTTGLTVTATLNKFTAGAGAAIDSDAGANPPSQTPSAPQTGTVVIMGPLV